MRLMGGGPMSRSADLEEVDSIHLEDVEDDCGCAEILEHSWVGATMSTRSVSLL